MNYALNGSIAEHFRDVGNAWQTVAQIAEATERTPKGVGSSLALLKKSGHLETLHTRPAPSYRIRPDRLHKPAPIYAGEQKRTKRITRKFCRKYGVNVPYEAISKSQAALTEWCEMLR